MLSIILAIIAAFFIFMYVQVRLNNHHLCLEHAAEIADRDAQVRDHRVAYKDLEKGRQEQEENYEQQFLTFIEKIAIQGVMIDNYEKKLAEMTLQLAIHEENCLPILTLSE